MLSTVQMPKLWRQLSRKINKWGAMSKIDIESIDDDDEKMCELK